MSRAARHFIAADHIKFHAFPRRITLKRFLQNGAGSYIAAAAFDLRALSPCLLDARRRQPRAASRDGAANIAYLHLGFGHARDFFLSRMLRAHYI